MLKLFIPVIFVIAAVGLFAAYTNPTYQDIKSLQQQNASYDAALSTVQGLISKLSTLSTQEDSMAPEDLSRLQQILPDNVDNIRLIIDINNIATRHNLPLSNVNLGDLRGSGTAAQAQQASGPVGTATISFAVATNSYDNFLAFVQDVEHSLRLVDITKLTLQAPTTVTSPVTYSMSLQTYWLH
jgi:Tfp pilus assembly protein PilO